MGGLKKSFSTLWNVGYNFKHFAPIGNDLVQHALSIHQQRLQLTKKFPKVNTQARELDASTTLAALIDMHGNTFTPSHAIVNTRLAPDNSVVFDNHLGPGYMKGKPYTDTSGNPDTHLMEAIPSRKMPAVFETSPPVTDQTLLDEKKRLQSSSQKFPSLPKI